MNRSSVYWAWNFQGRSSFEIGGNFHENRPEFGLKPIGRKIVVLDSRLMADDAQIIAEALEGSQQAYRKLMTRYEKTVYHVAFKIVRNEETARDITQESFMKAFAALSSYRSEYRFSTWLCKIAANTSIDHLRKRRIQALSLDQAVETEEGQVEVEIPDYSYHPEREYEAKQKMISIESAINSLPEKYRQVIVYRHQDDKSYDEIAELLNVPVGTVKARIFRARELLKKSLRGIR